MSYYDSKLWNSLPNMTRSLPTVAAFKSTIRILYLILTAVPFVNSCKFYLTVSIVNILYVLILLLYIYFITLIYFLGDISISLAILNLRLNKGLLLLSLSELQ